MKKNFIKGFCIMIVGILISIVSVSVDVKVYAAENVTTLIDTGLNFPYGLAVDSAGNLYIADYLNSAIKKRDTSGNVTTLVGSGLNRPFGVAVDNQGNLYIVDTFNGAVKKRDTAGNITTVVSGLNRPFAAVVDNAGNLYITDTDNNTIKKRDASGKLTTLVSSGVSYPGGLALDNAGNLYIAEGTAIKRRDKSGNLTTLISSGLNGVHSIVLDSAGNLYIADSYNLKIKKMDTEGNVTSLDIPSIRAYGLALDAAENLYASDTNRNSIKKITFVSNSSISPSNVSFDKYAGSTSNADVTISLNLNGNTLSSIKNGTAILSAATDYEVYGNNVIIKKEYLNALNTATATLTFGFSGGADQSLNIAVSDSTPATAAITAGRSLVRIMTGKPQYANAKIPFVIDFQSFSQNPTGYSFDVIYDPTKVGTVTVDSFNGLTKPTIGTTSPAADSSKEKVTVSWNGTLTGDYTSSKGILFKLNFVAKGGFTSGETPIEIGTGGSLTFASGTSSITGTPGKITSGIIYGDVNGDGAITSADTNLINKYTRNTKAITGEAKLTAADVNGDGSITAADATEISNYISLKASSLKTLFGY